MKLGPLNFNVSINKESKLVKRLAQKAASAPGNASAPWYGRWTSIVDTAAGRWQQDYNDLTNTELLAYSTVYSCMTLIANSISKLPLNLQKLDEKGIWVETTNPAYTKLLRRPAPQYDRISWVSYLIHSLLMDGNAFALKKYDQRGVVTALRLCDPTVVRTLITDEAEVWYRVRYDRLAGVLGSQIDVPARYVMHVRINPLQHPLLGCSPLKAALDAATAGSAIMRRENYMHTNKPTVSGVLQLPENISAEQAAAAKATWQATAQSTSNGTAVLESGITFQPLKFTAQEMETISALKLANEDIARAFNVPPQLIGLGTPMREPNSGVLMQPFYSNCLQPLMETIELAIGEAIGLPANMRVKFDERALLRLDNAARVTAHSEAIKGGWMTPNEARADEGLPPLPGGDDAYLQQQNYSLSALQKRDAQENPFATSQPATHIHMAPQPETQPPAEDAPEPQDNQEAEPASKGLQLADYAEIWKEGDFYQPGTTVTHKGGLWVALQATDSKPGSDDSWRLAVKSGKEAA